MCVLFSIFLVSFIGWSIFMHVTYRFDYYTFVIYLLIISMRSLALFSLFKIALAIWVFCGPTQILWLLYYFREMCHLNFERDYIRFVDDFGYYWHFNNILPIHEHKSLSTYLCLLYFLSSVMSGFIVHIFHLS